MLPLRANFGPGREVSDPGNLFGRASTLQSLNLALRSGIHTEIVAERKFGKSSLLRCVEASLGGRKIDLWHTFLLIIWFVADGTTFTAG